MVRRRPHEYRRRPDTYRDGEIREMYRFNRGNIEYICDLLHDRFSKGHTVTTFCLFRLLSRRDYAFFPSNSFQQVVGDVIGIHRSTCCKVIHEFSEAFCRQKGEFIRLPRDDQKRGIIKKVFFEMGGMPGVDGVIDCTHFRMSI